MHTFIERRRITGRPCVVELLLRWQWDRQRVSGHSKHTHFHARINDSKRYITTTNKE
jgi:hypothetical protein